MSRWLTVLLLLVIAACSVANLRGRATDQSIERARLDAQEAQITGDVATLKGTQLQIKGLLLQLKAEDSRYIWLERRVEQLQKSSDRDNLIIKRLAAPWLQVLK